MRLTLALCMLAAVWPVSAYAASTGCTADVVLRPDYTSRLVNYEATLRTTSQDRTCFARLDDLGMHTDLVDVTSPSETSVHGRIPAAVLQGPDSTNWHIILPLNLQTGDDFTFLLPFSSVDYANVTPAPFNAATLKTAPPVVVEGRLGTRRLEYRGAGTAFDLNIPFTPVKRTVELQLTPLLGEMLQGRTDSFRVSGTASWDVSGGVTEALDRCLTPIDPNTGQTSTIDTYRTADILSILDDPPRFSATLLPSIYNAKPAFLSVASTVTNCSLSSSGGHVEAAYNGRVLREDTRPDTFPTNWIGNESAECNRSIGAASASDEAARQQRDGCGSDSAKPRDGSGALYELRLGAVVLGPADTLNLSIPGAEISEIRPNPSQVSVVPGRGLDHVVYTGPAHFMLAVVYAPGLEMEAAQAPATAQALLLAAEQRILPCESEYPANQVNCEQALASPVGVLLALGLVTLVLFLAMRHAPLARIAFWTVWIAAAIVLTFGVRGAFGLIAAAIVLYAAGLARLSADRRLLGPLAALVLVALCVAVDSYLSTRSVRGPLDQETSPITPVVLLVATPLVGLAAAASVWLVRECLPDLAAPIFLLPAAVVLLAVASFDAVQKNVLAMVVLGAGLAYVALQTRGDPSMQGPAILDRFRRASRSRFVLAGTTILVIFAFEQGLESTNVVLAEQLHQRGGSVAVALLLASIVLVYGAEAVAFIFLYPVLPFRFGYLKGITFGLFLVILFAVGTGSDERLIVTLPSLLVGRAVYYVSIPGLLGVFFDMTDFQSVAGLPQGQAKDDKNTFANYVSGLRGQLNMAGAFLSILAPGVYSYIAQTPVVVGYFGVMRQLLAAS